MSDKSLDKGIGYKALLWTVAYVNLKKKLEAIEVMKASLDLRIKVNEVTQNSLNELVNTNAIFVARQRLKEEFI